MSLSQTDFDYVRDLVLRQSAIVLEGDKGYLAETRLHTLARTEGCTSVGDLVGRLRERRSNGLHQRVVEAMTTNETSFFRDQHPFEALRLVVLPELIRCRAAERRLHVWCAGCASGQEPYSLAMLVREHFPFLPGWNLRLLASDLSNDMLERARQGRYSALEIGRGLPPELRARYFDPAGPDWQIRDEVRRLVEFQRINLIDSWPPLPAFDVVFLRNVLIYMDTTAKKDILGRVRRVLRPDGYLFLGGAETPLNLDDAFVRVPVERAGCYRLRAGHG